MENLIEIKLDLTGYINYLVKKRDDALEHFNQEIKSHILTDEKLHKRLDIVLRMNHQIKTLEDYLIVYRVTKEKKK